MDPPSETEKLQQSVQSLEKTFQDLSVFLSGKMAASRIGTEPNFAVEHDDTNFQESDDASSTDLNQSSILHQAGDSSENHLVQDDLQFDELNMSAAGERITTTNNKRPATRTSRHLRTTLFHTSQPKRSRRSSSRLSEDDQRERDIREISNLLLDLQDDETFLDQSVTKEHTKQAEKQAKQLVELVKEAGTIKILDMEKETQFMRELDDRLGISQEIPPTQPKSSWEEVSMLRTQWMNDIRRPSNIPPPAPKTVKELFLESQPNLQSPSRFDALQTRSEEPTFVQEFTAIPYRRTRKALLVGVYNPQLPSAEESLKRMYNICRILNFDEIMVLDTKNGTRKGVILHYYNELLKDATASDVRLFYIYGEAQLIYKEPSTYSFRDSTRRREVGVSRWDLGSTLHTSCIRIWDAILDKGFDEHVCEHTPLVSHVSCEITAATLREDLTRYSASPFSNGLFEIVRWYAERRRVCTNRSLKFHLRLMQDEGEFGSGGVEFECLRQELDTEFTAVLNSAKLENE